jgi:hypothetical protein
MEATVKVRSLDEKIPIKKRLINMKLRRKEVSLSVSLKTGKTNTVIINMNSNEMKEASDSQ